MICVLCGVVAACHMYVLCAVWWCGSMFYLLFVKCLLVLQPVFYSVFIIWLCRSVL